MKEITEGKAEKKAVMKKPLNFWFGVSIGIVLGMLISPAKNISVRVIVNATVKKKE